METNKITISNYEAFMVDYWDGNLDPLQQEMLMCFLEENPDIKKDFLDAGQYTLPDEHLFFDAKADLMKQEVSNSNIDEFLVAELEHCLLPHEQNDLNLFIASNPKYKRDRALYSLTKLTPDKNFIYPDKRSLKKGVIQPLWIRYSSVAAAACVFFALGIWWFNRAETAGMARSGQHINLPELHVKPNVVAVQNDRVELNPAVKPEAVNNNFSGDLIVKEAVTSNPQQKPTVSPMEIKDAVLEDFYSYSKNRRADDYLSGLVNSYIPEETNVIAYNNEEPAINKPIDPVLKPNAAEVVNSIAAKGLTRMIKDSALANELKNQKYSVKTKVASAIAWATGKASGGKVKAIAIPNMDGSLAALSFTNGRYNYTKRF